MRLRRICETLPWSVCSSGSVVRLVDDERDVLVDGERLEHAAQRGEQVGGREGLDAQLDLAGLDLAQVEQVVDQRRELLGSLADVLHLLFLLRRQLAVEPVQQDLRQRQDRVHGRAELVTDARQESRLGLVGGAQVRGALVQLRIQRHHAAVRVFELGIQSRQLFLAQPQLFQAAQQVAILLLHFDARVARAMRGDRASERFDARPRERLGASRHVLAQCDRGTASRRGLDLECVHQAPRRHQPELRLAGRRRAADRGLEVGDARSLVGDGDRQRWVASAFFFERELDAAAAAVTNGVARDFGHCGGDANLVLRIEVEQGADLPRALAGGDHVAIVRQLQLQQWMSHDVVRRSTTIRESSRPRLQSRYSTPAIVAHGCCISPG